MLSEWTTQFIKHKDAFERKLQNISAQGNTIICTYKDRKATYCVLPDLLLGNVPKEQCTVVCQNSRKNVDELVKHWKEFSALPVTLIFVNEERNDKWIIVPRTHNLIADPDSLEQGLLALFQNANGKVEDLPKKKGMFSDISDESDAEE